MNDSILSTALTTFLGVLMFGVIFLIIKLFKQGFRSLLIKTNIISPNENRSYTQLVGFAVGKVIGKSIRRK